MSRVPAALASLKLGVGELGGFTGSGTRRLGPPELFPEPEATLPVPEGAAELDSFLGKEWRKIKLRSSKTDGHRIWDPKEELKARQLEHAEVNPISGSSRTAEVLRCAEGFRIPPTIYEAKRRDETVLEPSVIADAHGAIPLGLAMRQGGRSFISNLMSS